MREEIQKIFRFCWGIVNYDKIRPIIMKNKLRFVQYINKLLKIYVISEKKYFLRNVNYYND